MDTRNILKYGLWLSIASLFLLHTHVHLKFPSTMSEMSPHSMPPQDNILINPIPSTLGHFRDTYLASNVDDLSRMVRQFHCLGSRQPNVGIFDNKRNIGESFIPQRIVQIGRSKDLSTIETAVQEGILSWMMHHPCYDYVFLDDTAIEKFLKKSQQRYLQAYNSLVNGGERADLVRYIYMHEMGGIYADTDTRVLKPAESWGLRYADAFIVGLEADFASEQVAREWIYARARSASLHTFGVSPQNPILQRVIDLVVDNIENQGKVYDEVRARGIGLPSHLETIFKTGPGPFSDIVFGNAGKLETGSRPMYTRLLGLWEFSGKHSQGSKFYVEQLKRSKVDRTVFVEHMNLGSWLKPYPKFTLATSMDTLRSGSSLVGGEWIAAKKPHEMSNGKAALWCYSTGRATGVNSQGFLYLNQTGNLLVGEGKGPRDPKAVIMFQKSPDLTKNISDSQYKVFDLHLDKDGVLSLSLLEKRRDVASGALPLRHRLWSLSGAFSSVPSLTGASARHLKRCDDCYELTLELGTDPKLCVHRSEPSEKTKLRLRGSWKDHGLNVFSL